jgi:hypothetical protein
VVQGIDKDINEIRTILNKMSETNFESQKTVIICKINDIIEKDGDDGRAYQDRRQIRFLTLRVPINFSPNCMLNYTRSCR